MKIHCIGIGGIGLSALARYYKHEGYTVSGSDASTSELTKSLAKEGVTIYQGHSKDNMTSDIDMVVYSIAVQDTNEELAFAKAQGILCKTYPEALGEVTKTKITIAVCGTHGKTTTTAMTYYALKACGINPTIIVGSLLSKYGTNFIPGDSEYLVVEACEYRRSFLNLHPTHIIVTNIDEDHLDYYKDLDDIKSAFQSFVDKLPPHGTLTCHSDVHLTTTCKTFCVDFSKNAPLTLSVLGEHNQKNALLPLTLLTHLHYDEASVRKGLYSFPGTWRRLEYKGKTLHGAPVYDDYGHHPKEIEVSIQALRAKYTKETLVMLFQPHLYSRTKAFFDDFVSVLATVDLVYILPIYRARSEDTTVVSEQMLIDAINKRGGNAYALESLGDIPATIESIQEENSVIVNMGAGNAFEELNKVTFV